MIRNLLRTINKTTMLWFVFGGTFGIFVALYIPSTVEVKTVEVFKTVYVDVIKDAPITEVVIDVVPEIVLNVVPEVVLSVVPEVVPVTNIVKEDIPAPTEEEPDPKFFTQFRLIVEVSTKTPQDDVYVISQVKQLCDIVCKLPSISGVKVYKIEGIDGEEAYDIEAYE